MFFCGVWPPFCEAEVGTPVLSNASPLLTAPHLCLHRPRRDSREDRLFDGVRAGSRDRVRASRRSREAFPDAVAVRAANDDGKLLQEEGPAERRERHLREREQVREDVFPRRKLRRVPEMDRDARLVHGTRRPRVRAQRQRRRVRSGRHAAEDAFGSAGVRGLRAGRLRVLVRARGGRGALRPRVRPRRRHLQQPRRRQRRAGWEAR